MKRAIPAPTLNRATLRYSLHVPQRRVLGPFLPDQPKRRRLAERGYPAQGPADLSPRAANACSRRLISRHPSPTAARLSRSDGSSEESAPKDPSAPTPSSNPSCPRATCDACQRSSSAGHDLPGTESGYPAQGPSSGSLSVAGTCPQHLTSRYSATAARAGHSRSASQARLYPV